MTMQMVYSVVSLVPRKCLLDIRLARTEKSAVIFTEEWRRMTMRQWVFVKHKNFVIFFPLSWLLVWTSVGWSADQIRVGYGSLSTSYAAIWVAGEAGLFRKNGINAEVLYLESALVRTALIAGDIAMGGMSGTTMAAPRLQGADPVIIASFAKSLQYRFVCGRLFAPWPISRASAWASRALVSALIAARRSYWPSLG